MRQREKREKEKTKREILSKYYLDMSKTAFGTTVLANLPVLFELTEFSCKIWLMLSFGTISAVAFAYVGYKFLK